MGRPAKETTKASSSKRKGAVDESGEKIMRPRSAYILFSSHFRPQITKENPSLSMTDVSKVLGQKWSEATAEEKAPFEEQSAQEKAAFKDKYPEGIPRESSKKTKKIKDENAPKRALTAYFFFANDKRPEIREQNPDMKITEISKVIGEMWKDTSDEEKAKYQKMADADKDRYAQEMKDYKGE